MEINIHLNAASMQILFSVYFSYDMFHISLNHCDSTVSSPNTSQVKLHKAPVSCYTNMTFTSLKNAWRGLTPSSSGWER